MPLHAVRAEPSLPPLRLLVERRFPLEMNVTLPQIRDLYDTGKAGRWNPHRDVDWGALAPEGYPEPVREAARRTWSRRVWTESTGLTETPALIVRFCMEVGREIDPKFYLTTRNTEEAWHVECFDRLAEGFGGRIARPAAPAYEAVFNRHLHRRVMGAGQMLDAYVAAHAAFEDGLELELARAWRAHASNPAVQGVLDHVIADKERHAAFGWLYLAARAEGWSKDERETIASELCDYVRDVVLKGYHCPWLAPELARAEAEADAIVADAGLGGAPRAAEEDALATYAGNARTRLAELGITLPAFETNRMRSF
ncbi:hypothetical protein EZH22_27120 [Xanthobacter dioxanivorans]|uniref:Ferritin-like domain-containing protein n=1 Tax=Xanthobacter dioxanivorans TaxID=2528964 RepID=A0A974PNM0_9HYPH|nr:hypothetical protein [Xanthobacter dioxanivorans]QRG06558.1 hypothetical protein EZH22_27120 [Xanthobacter dioxanivorans]